MHRLQYHDCISNQLEKRENSIQKHGKPKTTTTTTTTWNKKPHERKIVHCNELPAKCWRHRWLPLKNTKPEIALIFKGCSRSERPMWQCQYYRCSYFCHIFRFYHQFQASFSSSCINAWNIIESTRLQNKRPFRFMITFRSRISSFEFTHMDSIWHPNICVYVWVHACADFIGVSQSSTHILCMDHTQQRRRWRPYSVCPHGNEFDGIVFDKRNV